MAKKITKTQAESKMNVALLIGIIGLFFCSIPFGIWSACIYGKYEEYLEGHEGKRAAIIIVCIIDIVGGLIYLFSEL